MSRPISIQLCSAHLPIRRVRSASISTIDGMARRWRRVHPVVVVGWVRRRRWRSFKSVPEQQISYRDKTKEGSGGLVPRSTRSVQGTKQSGCTRFISIVKYAALTGFPTGSYAVLLEDFAQGRQPGRRRNRTMRAPSNYYVSIMISRSYEREGRKRHILW